MLENNNFTPWRLVEKNANEAQRGSWDMKQLPLHITLTLDVNKIALSVSNFVSSCWEQIHFKWRREVF